MEVFPPVTFNLASGGCGLILCCGILSDSNLNCPQAQAHYTLLEQCIQVRAGVLACTVVPICVCYFQNVMKLTHLMMKRKKVGLCGWLWGWLSLGTPHIPAESLSSPDVKKARKRPAASPPSKPPKALKLGKVCTTTFVSGSGESIQPLTLGGGQMADGDEQMETARDQESDEVCLVCVEIEIPEELSLLPMELLLVKSLKRRRRRRRRKRRRKIVQRRRRNQVRRRRKRKQLRKLPQRLEYIAICGTDCMSFSFISSLHCFSLLWQAR